MFLQGRLDAINAKNKAGSLPFFVSKRKGETMYGKDSAGSYSSPGSK